MSSNISHVVLSTVISYHKCDINVLNKIYIEACAIHFSMEILETGYPVMGKITGN